MSTRIREAFESQLSQGGMILWVEIRLVAIRLMVSVEPSVCRHLCQVCRGAQSVALFTQHVRKRSTGYISAGFR